MNGNQIGDITPEEIRGKEELGKMASEGNIYAIHQQKTDSSGLGANLEALLPKEPCKHIVELGRGHFRRRVMIETTRCEGFVFKEKTCTFCGKTLEIAIYKPKRPRRLGDFK